MVLCDPMIGAQPHQRARRVVWAMTGALESMRSAYSRVILTSGPFLRSVERGWRSQTFS